MSLRRECSCSARASTPSVGGVYGFGGHVGSQPPGAPSPPPGLLDLAGSGLSSGCLGTGPCSRAQLTSRTRGWWARWAAAGRAQCEPVQRAGRSRAPQAPLGGREKAGAHPRQAAWGLPRAIRLPWDGASWTAAGHPQRRPVQGLRGLRVRTGPHVRPLPGGAPRQKRTVPGTRQGSRCRRPPCPRPGPSRPQVGSPSLWNHTEGKG